MVIPQQSKNLNHPRWRKEGGKKFVQNADGVLCFLELSVTNPHPEFGLIGKGTLWEIGEQPLETPEGLFCFAL